MTYDEAYRIAKEMIIEWADDDISYAIWNYTGFPDFWDGDPATVQRNT